MAYYAGRLDHWAMKHREEEPLLHFPVFPYNNTFARRLFFVFKRRLMALERFALPSPPPEELENHINEESTPIVPVVSYASLVKNMKENMKQSKTAATKKEASRKSERVAPRDSSLKERSTSKKEPSKASSKEKSTAKVVGLRFSSSTFVKPGNSSIGSKLNQKSNASPIAPRNAKEELLQKRRQEKLDKGVTAASERLSKLLLRQQGAFFERLQTRHSQEKSFMRLHQILYSPDKYQEQRQTLLPLAFRLIRKPLDLQVFGRKARKRRLRELLSALALHGAQQREAQSAVYTNRLKMKALTAMYKTAAKKKLLVMKFFSRVASNTHYDLKDAFKKLVFRVRNHLLVRKHPASFSLNQISTENSVPRFGGEEAFLIEEYNQPPERSVNKSTSTELLLGFDTLHNNERLVTGAMPQSRAKGSAPSEKYSDKLLRLFKLGEEELHGITTIPKRPPKQTKQTSKSKGGKNASRPNEVDHKDTRNRSRQKSIDKLRDNLAKQLAYLLINPKAADRASRSHSRSRSGRLPSPSPGGKMRKSSPALKPRPGLQMVAGVDKALLRRLRGKLAPTHRELSCEGCKIYSFLD